jgi:peptide deformylase
MLNLDQNYTPNGSELKIFTYPATVLKKVAAPVVNFDGELEQLCKDMLFTMYQAPGIGLAAPQVGKSLRLFVLDIDFDREEITAPDGSTEYRLSNFNPHVFINPVIKEIEGEILYEEGCLSVPGIYEEVKRTEHITVEYQDHTGAHKSLDAHGTLAVCIQHENDHLNGIVFLERLSMIKRNLLTKKYLKRQKKNL